MTRNCRSSDAKLFMNLASGHPLGAEKYRKQKEAPLIAKRTIEKGSVAKSRMCMQTKKNGSNPVITDILNVLSFKVT